MRNSGLGNLVQIALRCVLLSALPMLSACEQRLPPHAESTKVASPPVAAAPLAMPRLPSAADAAGDPSAALDRFLAYHSFRGAPAGSDSLSGCPPFPPAGEGESDEGWEPDNYVGFVLGRVLGAAVDASGSSDESATGRAEVMRVAAIGRDSAGWLGTLEHRLDTLSFTLERGPTGWTVCGPAFKARTDSLPPDMEFVLTYDDAVRTEVNSARWLPIGTTLPAVSVHADSALLAGRRGASVTPPVP